VDVNDILTIVREDYLDDTFEGWESASQAERDDQLLWSDKALFRYITEAQRQACNRTDFIFDDSSSITKLTLKANVNEYRISSYINTIEQLEYNGKKVTHISREDRNRSLLQWRTNTGIGTNRSFYMIQGRKLFIYPIPDSTDAGKKVYLSVWRQPLDPIASSSDELSIPEEYQRDLVWWVLYEAYSKQDADGYDKDKGLGYLAQFNQAFGDYIPSEVRLNQLQEPESLRPRPIDYVGNSRLNRFGNDRHDDAEWYR